MIKDKSAAEKPTITCDDLDKRVRTDTSFQTMTEEDLLLMLKETKSLHDEADILHYLLEIKFEF